MDDIKTTAANTRLVCTANVRLVSGSGAAEAKVVISSNGGQAYEVVPPIEIGRGAVLIDDWDVTGPGNHNVAVFLRASGAAASVKPGRLSSLWIEPFDYV